MGEGDCACWFGCLFVLLTDCTFAQMKLIEEQIFTAKDLDGSSFEIAQYELCTFNTIDFKGISFSNVKFVECNFVDCDLSMLNLTGSMLQEVQFTRCKMLGLFFETVKPFLFQVGFDHCNLETSSFSGVNMQNTNFNACKLTGVDYTETDLSGATFIDCDLFRASFQNTNLSATDLRMARNFSIDIQSNRVKKAIVSNTNLEGFLSGAGLDIRD